MGFSTLIVLAFIQEDRFYHQGVRTVEIRFWKHTLSVCFCSSMPSSALPLLPSLFLCVRLRSGGVDLCLLSLSLSGSMCAADPAVPLRSGGAMPSYRGKRHDNYLKETLLSFYFLFSSE